MKILHIITGLDTGGAELMLQRLIIAAKNSSDFEHCVVSLTEIGKIGTHLQQYGIKVVACDMRSMFAAPLILLSLFRIIRKERPDIVQTWMYHADLLGGVAARWAGVSRVIWGIRRTELLAGDSRITIAVRGVCALLSSKIPTVIVCAAEAARRSHIAIGYDPSNMVLVHNGFDLRSLAATVDQRLAFRAQLGLNDQHVVIGSLGSVKPAKDHGNFIRAAGLLAANWPHLKFLLVGRGIDNTNADLMKLIVDSGHMDRFVLLSERSDVWNCYAAMDVFCLHSRTEGFPNVVGEAMAMGLPCVVTDVGDAGILIGDTGRVVPRENSFALAQTLGELLAMPEIDRRKLGNEARTRIQNKFDIKRSVQRFESLYRTVTQAEGH